MNVRLIKVLFWHYFIRCNKTHQLQVWFLTTISSANTSKHAEWKDVAPFPELIHPDGRIPSDFVFPIWFSRSRIHPSTRSVQGFPSLTAISVYSTSLETKEGFPLHQRALGPPRTPPETLNPAMQTLRRATRLSLCLWSGAEVCRDTPLASSPGSCIALGEKIFRPGPQPETEPYVIPSCSYTQLLLGGVCNRSVSLQSLPQSWSKFFFFFQCGCY